jgi:hypothetical protein
MTRSMRIISEADIKNCIVFRETEFSISSIFRNLINLMQRFVIIKLYNNLIISQCL